MTLHKLLTQMLLSPGIASDLLLAKKTVMLCYSEGNCGPVVESNGYLSPDL